MEQTPMERIRKHTTSVLLFLEWESERDFLSPETTEDVTTLNIKKYSTDVKIEILVTQ